MSRGLQDHDVSLPHRTTPAPVRPPLGPANFPVTGPEATAVDLLKALVAQSQAKIPQIRSSDITAAGQTLDWSALGLMDRILIRNKGANSVWIAWDVNGEAVDAFTSDLSFELQAQEAISIPACQFYKIGCKCAAGQTGTVHAVAFLATTENLSGSIS